MSTLDARATEMLDMSVNLISNSKFSQPQVDMEITIPDYTRYKVKIAYQLEDSFQEYTGTIIATNKE